MRAFGLAVVVSGCACGASVTDSTRSDASPDARTDVSIPDTDVETPSGTDCAALVASLVPVFVGPSCTTTIRLLESSRAIVGWNAQCGEQRAVLTGAEARAAFAPFAVGADIPPYAPKADAYEMRRDGTRGDVFIFYVLGGDWGGLAAVSAQRGDVALFGTVVWGGSGRIRTPSAWRTGPETTAACSTEAEPPRLDPVATSEILLDDARVATVRDVLTRSPIMHAVDKAQTVTSGVLTVYPLDVGTSGAASSSKRTEYVVLIESATTIE